MNHDRDWRPFAKGGFPTSSGKAELFSEALFARGLDPLPAVGEIRHGTGSQLQLITGKTLHFLNSSYSHIDRHRRREGTLYVEMNAADASGRSLKDGQMVDVSNSQGKVKAVCRISDRVGPGLAWMPFGGNGDAEGNPNSVNTLTPEEPTDWGGGSGFYDTFVEITACHSDPWVAGGTHRSPRVDATATS